MGLLVSRRQERDALHFASTVPRAIKKRSRGSPRSAIDGLETARRGRAPPQKNEASAIGAETDVGGREGAAPTLERRRAAQPAISAAISYSAEWVTRARSSVPGAGGACSPAPSGNDRYTWPSISGA